MRKESQKVVLLHNRFMTLYYVISNMTWSIFFDEISVSLECHPVMQRDYDIQ